MVGLAVSPAIGIVIRRIDIGNIFSFFFPIARVIGHEADGGFGFIGVYIIGICTGFFYSFGHVPERKLIAVNFLRTGAKARVIPPAQGGIDRSAQ